MNPPTLADLIDESEVARLMADYGPGPRWQTRIEMADAHFDFWWTKIVVKGNRRGEIVLALQRPDARVLLHTKPFYPSGIYRLPTGGIYPGEAVLVGAVREAKEETDLDICISRFVGMVEYEFIGGDRRLVFVSYVLQAQVGDAPPTPSDADERISGFRYVAVAELRDVADILRRLPGRWAGWGAFRAPAHDMTADALVK